ncbi:MAG: hypothetical protein IPP13_12780 [Kouleothrix sp.]|jgi:hypothetical protein|nr:hypothetical protein [Kouleothrix sp.]
MPEDPTTLAAQIAALEAALQLPGLPAETQRQLREQLRALQAPSAIQGHVANGGDLHGNAVGVNYGTVQAFFGAPPGPAAAAGAPAATPQAIDDQRALLAAHRRTLAVYLRQLATLGSAYAPPSVPNGMREARAGIRQAKAALRGWGVAVEDLPDDEEPGV